MKSPYFLGSHIAVTITSSKERKMREKRSDSWMRKVVWAGVPAVVTVALASFYGQALSQETADVTFARDVAPILQQNCQTCHREGAIGPMSLITYEQAKLYAPLIKLKVTTQQMPPYQYDTDVGIQALKSDMRLSAAEIETIAQWVDQGAAEGDPADMPAPRRFADLDEWRLSAEYDYGEPDLVVKSKPVTIPAEGQDLWWEPLVPIGNTTPRYIRAIEVRPSAEGRMKVHHANTTMSVMEDGELKSMRGRFTEYASGKLGEIVPSDAARLLPVDSYVRWSVHMHPNGQEVVDDVMQLGFWLYPEGYEPEYEQSLKSYALQGDLDIAPHGTAMTQGFHTWDHPVRIDSFQPHGHLRLVAKSLEIFYPDTGEREMVSMVSNWNAWWQISHIYEEDAAPLVPTGAVMILTAWYDNTENNPLNPDPDVWVGRGSRTADEMSHAWIAVTHLDDEGYERIKASREVQQVAEGGG
jgi:hypothetical protein